MLALSDATLMVAGMVAGMVAWLVTMAVLLVWWPAAWGEEPPGWGEGVYDYDAAVEADAREARKWAEVAELHAIWDLPAQEHERPASGS